ncbi:zinc finger MYM-type protein 1-like [Hydra vulgaris]|uniref:Zinc finger MYM-type protein 1-like n=1 Tax=Hydra vulgaris TaxID=6087 RepID=A0ABM4CRX7_HYDVU
MKGDVSDHYCGKDIQNELIELIGKKVNTEKIAKKSKYYSIIADCTPDITHLEQLLLTIRFVDLSSDDDKISVKEHFIEFLTVNESTGERLTKVIIDVLNKYGLELNDCWGQDYDNGSNMKGKNIGVQRRILDINPLAVYVPCACHSYNLLLCDTAKLSVKSVTLFGVLQSKSLQSTDMDLGKCTEMLKKCCTFLEEYRNTEFKRAILMTKELAEALEIEPVFKVTSRVRCIRRQAGETVRDEPITSSKKKKKSFNERFDQLSKYSESWSFLYNIKQILEKPDLVEFCGNLQLKLTVESQI